MGSELVTVSRARGMKSIPANFIGVSVIYFLIGAFWMGFGQFIWEPTYTEAHEIFMTAQVHVMVLGWATLAIMGGLYYLVPRLVGKEEMFSRRLGRIHFWVTNITMPIGILLVVYGSTLIDSLIANGVPDGQGAADPSVLPILLAYVVLFVAGYAAQFIFAYNVYKTLGTKAG